MAANAIVRVDPATEKVSLYPLPSGRENANLNRLFSISVGFSGSPARAI
jgi:streptogramin lyase